MSSVHTSEGAVRRGIVMRIALSAFTAAVLAQALWACSFVIARSVYETVPPIGLNFWRNIVAIIFMALLAWRHLKSDLPVILAHWKGLTMLGLFLVTIGNTAVYIGLQTTTVINAGVINSMAPVFVIVLSFLLFAIPVPALRWLGVVLSLFGVIFLITRADLAVLTALDVTIGDLWMLLAALGWGLYGVYLHRLAPKIHILSLAAAYTFLGTVALLPFYLWEHLTQRVMPTDGFTVGVVVYLGVFVSSLAVLAWTRAIQLLGAPRTAPFSHLAPVFAISAGIVFLGEAFHLYHAVGIAIIAVGIWLSTIITATPAGPVAPKAGARD